MPQQTFCLETVPTPLGPMLIVTDAEGCLRAADFDEFEDRLRRYLRRHHGAVTLQPHEAQPTSAAARALEDYFNGDLSALKTVRINANGTEFQRAVWSALRTIPVGSTLSYGALAWQIGNPKAVRAVGLANGANPIPVFVPCHRVIGADGSLTGFGGGLHRKRWLLAHEAPHIFRR